MATKNLPVLFGLIFALAGKAQPGDTFVKSFDPNPQNMFIADKATNVWSIDNYIYVVTGYIKPQGGRRQQLFKIDASTLEIEKTIEMDGPQGDIAITEFGGGYFLTSDNHILLTGEWRDYSNTKKRTFIAKLDKDLEVVWINYYPDLFEYHVFGEAIAEMPSGDIMFYLTEGKSLPTGDPWQTVESWIRIIKTDALGNPIFNKVVPDTFAQTVGYGHMSRAEDGTYLVSSQVIGYYYHPIFGTYRNNAILHKLDDNANPIWSRMINYCKYARQEPIATALPGSGGAVMWSRDTFTTDPNIAFEFNELHRLDSDGNTLWTHEWNDVSVRYVYRITTAANGDILGCGAFQQNADRGKTWLFRISSDGELLWERHYSDSIQRPWSPGLEMLDLCEMADGRIAATGLVFDTSAIGTLNVNIGLMVLGADGCLEPNCNGLNQYITGTYQAIIKNAPLPQMICSPNPASAIVQVEFPQLLGTTQNKQVLQCYDAQGKLMAQINWESAVSAQPIDVNHWPTGTYQLLFFEEGRALFSGKFLVLH
jgi:hypothetical protein